MYSRENRYLKIARTKPSKYIKYQKTLHESTKYTVVIFHPKTGRGDTYILLFRRSKIKVGTRANIVSTIRYLLRTQVHECF